MSGMNSSQNYEKFCCALTRKLHSSSTAGGELVEKKRSNPMQNIRSITCESCSEPAVEYDNNTQCVDDFNGKVFHCQSCSALGRVDIDGEYNVAQVMFILLDKEEISHVEFPVLVDAYEASQKKIDELYEEVSKLKMKIKENDEYIKSLHQENDILRGEPV
jgi:hypothetical protein